MLLFAHLAVLLAVAVLLFAQLVLLRGQFILLAHELLIMRARAVAGQRLLETDARLRAADVRLLPAEGRLFAAEAGLLASELNLRGVDCGEPIDCAGIADHILVIAAREADVVVIDRDVVALCGDEKERSEDENCAFHDRLDARGRPAVGYS